VDLAGINFSDFEITYSIQSFENLAMNLISVRSFLVKNGVFPKIAKLNTCPSGLRVPIVS